MLYRQEKKECYSQLIHHPHPHRLPLPIVFPQPWPPPSPLRQDFHLALSAAISFSFFPSAWRPSSHRAACRLQQCWSTSLPVSAAPLMDQLGESPLSCVPHSAQNKEAEGGLLSALGCLNFSLVFFVVRNVGFHFSLTTRLVSICRVFSFPLLSGGRGPPLPRLLLREL